MTTTVTTTIVARPEVRPELQALRREIAGLERHGYLFGKKLTQSFSPFLHDIIYRELGLNWAQIRLDSIDMDLFLRLVRAPSFYGASVTMPHKVAIIRHLDELTEECRDVGACNTLFLRSDPATGRRLLCGANTDVIGVRESFYQNVPDPDAVFHGRPALVLGGGGAARSAVYALHRWMRATEIYVVNRDDAEVAAVQRECADRGFGTRLRHVRTVDEARALPAPGAIVACVPDFPPVTPDERRARDVVRAFLDKPEKGAMLEMCYNPTPYTELAAIAEDAGWQVILGTEALIWQGIAQDKYWTGQELAPETVKVVQRAVASRLPRR